MEFWLKDQLYFHWYKSCAKYCSCDNCKISIYYNITRENKIQLFFNKTNIHLSIMQVLKEFFPNLSLENVFQKENSNPLAKQIKIDQDVEMTEV
jgi:hypothetical protein